MRIFLGVLVRGHFIDVGARMIAAGYMAKRVEQNPDWLGAPNVDDIFSVSPCLSEDFADYVSHWQHNGYWFFDTPEAIRRLAERNATDLAGTRLFYYEVHEQQFDEEAGGWEPFGPEPALPLAVETPAAARLEGYDVVSFAAEAQPECSPLSCNGLAEDIATNRHCLLASFEEAKDLLEQGRFANCEPGPYRIFAVHTVDWP